MENELKEIELKELELMNENENREFYVYLHIRLDNNTPFYVGKGTKNRAHNLDRGDFHNSVREKYGCRVEIIKDNLTESQAFRLESKMIKYYVLTLGYGIPIDGYRDFSNNYLTNFTWGGEGTSGRKCSEEQKQKISEKNKGKNPFAGKTEEEMEIITNKMSNSMKGKNAGEKNGMFGKNPYDGKTSEEMEEIRRKRIEKLGKKVICITTGRIFNSLPEASKYYKCYHICECCKGKRNYAGKLKDGTPLKWVYLENYNNEFKGILINPIIK